MGNSGFMKKINFNDDFSQTQAVLDGLKTTERKIIPFHGECIARHFNPRLFKNGIDPKAYLRDWRGNCRLVEHDTERVLLPYYKLGEIVAVAQSYSDIMHYYHSLGNVNTRVVGDDESLFWNAMREIESTGNDSAMRGDDNKLFTKANLMPHQVEITGIRAEHLQDITDEECLKEGIEFAKGGYYTNYNKDNNSRTWLGNTPKEAYATLIEEIHGKGTWEWNPLVWVYDFVLVK